MFTFGRLAEMFVQDDPPLTVRYTLLLQEMYKVSGGFFTRAMLARLLVAAEVGIGVNTGAALKAFVLWSNCALLRITHTSFASVAEISMSITCLFTFVTCVHTGGFMEISSDLHTSVWPTKAILLFSGVNAISTSLPFPPGVNGGFQETSPPLTILLSPYKYHTRL